MSNYNHEHRKNMVHTAKQAIDLTRHVSEIKVPALKNPPGERDVEEFLGELERTVQSCRAVIDRFDCIANYIKEEKP